MNINTKLNNIIVIAGDPFDSSKSTDLKVACEPKQGGKESACLKVKISKFFYLFIL